MISDEELAQRLTGHINANPYASRYQVMKACNTTLYRMKRLQDAGLVKLPCKMSKSIAATKARKNGGWKAGIKLRKGG